MIKWQSSFSVITMMAVVVDGHVLVQIYKCPF